MTWLLAIGFFLITLGVVLMDWKTDCHIGRCGGDDKFNRLECQIAEIKAMLQSRTPESRLDKE